MISPPGLYNQLDNDLTSVFWTYNTFVNNFAIKFTLERYLKDSCSLVSDSHFFLCFLNFFCVAERYH